MNLQNLPADTLGSILCQLNSLIGTPGLVNRADIKVFSKHVHNLACTSKAIYKKIYDLSITSILLNHLSGKYSMLPENVAITLNTQGSLKWVWNAISSNHLDEYYEDIQEILKFRDKILLEAKDCGFELVANDHKKNFKDDSPGFFIIFNDFAPTWVETPIGLIPVLKQNKRNPSSLSERFVRAFDAIFVDYQELWKFKPLEVISTQQNGLVLLENNDVKKITKNEVLAKKGSPALIMGSGSSRYRIRSIGNKRLEFEEGSINRKFSPEFYEYAWKLLEDRRLDLKKSTIKHTIESLFNHLGKVVDWALQLMMELEKSPIVIRTLVETKALRLLNCAANINNPNIQELKIFNLDADTGFVFFNISSERTFNLEELRIAYQEVIEKATSDWKKRTLENFDHWHFEKLRHVKSEEEYDLYVKETDVFCNYAEILGFIALNLGVKDFINWGTIGLEMEYLWIRKDKHEQVRRALNLRFI